MSKKTKRLEKENLTLNRKHDATNRNILEMAEERTKLQEELAKEKKKGIQMNNIIKQMQKQGRGAATGMAEGMETQSQYAEGDLEGTESEYEEGYDDEEGEEGEEGSVEGEEEYDEDTEDDEKLQTFGPAPPPTLPPPNAVVNPMVNGARKH